MPTGKVKWYDKEKGFGFLAGEDGQEVFLPKSALPEGVTELKAGTRVEFGVADGRKGAQALGLRVMTKPFDLTDFLALLELTLPQPGSAWLRALHA